MERGKDKGRGESDSYEARGSGWQDQWCILKCRTTSFLSNMAWKCVRTSMPWFLGDVCPLSLATLHYCGHGTVGTPANAPHTLMPVGCCERGREWQPFFSFNFQPLNLALPLQAQRTICWKSLPCTVTHVSWEDLLWPFVWRISILLTSLSVKTDFSWDQAVFLAFFWIQHLNST